MELQTLGTGSKGNCYILKSNNGKFIILDCGIKFTDITQEIGSFKNLDLVFVSHSHLDHSRSLQDFKNSGCECITYENIISQQKVTIGQWELLPFILAHNDLNYGVIIKDTYDNTKVVYATDFSEIPLIKNVDNWIYEINYDEFTINKLIDKPNFDLTHLHHNLAFHNSLEKAVDYFEKVGNVNNLMICHLSEIGGVDKHIEQKMKKYANNLYILKKKHNNKFLRTII